MVLFLPWGEAPRWQLTGSASGQMLGYALAGGLDLGWDPSLKDFVIGSPGEQFVVIVDENGEELAWVPAAHPVMQMEFGAEVATPGDLDSDGSPDLVIGAPASSLPQSYVYYGPLDRTSGPGFTEKVEEADFQWTSTVRPPASGQVRKPLAPWTAMVRFVDCRNEDCQQE